MALAGSRAWLVLRLGAVRCSACGGLGWLSRSADQWPFSRLRGCPSHFFVLSLSAWGRPWFRACDGGAVAVFFSWGEWERGWRWLGAVWPWAWSENTGWRRVGLGLSRRPVDRRGLCCRRRISAGPGRGYGSADGITICPSVARAGGVTAGFWGPPTAGCGVGVSITICPLPSLCRRRIWSLLFPESRVRCCPSVLGRDWAAPSCPVISRRNRGWDRMDRLDGWGGRRRRSVGGVPGGGLDVSVWRRCRCGGGVGLGCLFCWRGDVLV